MEKGTCERLQQQYLADISDYLKSFVDTLYQNPYEELREIFNYHLGLNDPIEKQGKRIRPMLMLLCASGCGISIADAMPAAAAIELIHNFSLVHDDIEDNGETRRGKDAVWKKWGLAQGVNAGDAMFNAAFLVMDELHASFPEGIIAEADRLMLETCSQLTKGQYLDIGFETQDEVSLEKYFEMISGKTAALLGCAPEMAAILAGLKIEQRIHFRDFGQSLGIAFQIYDDWLGIWGDERSTGKLVSGDLLEKKKTFPIILGLQTSSFFRDQLMGPPLNPEKIVDITNHLSEIGVEDRTKVKGREWTDKALQALDLMECEQTQKVCLREITNKLLIRER